MSPIDVYKLLVWLVPSWLRKSNTMLLLQAWVYPLHVLRVDFTRFMNAKLYRLNNNGQVCYLQKVLNDTFDSAQRRIRVVNFAGVNRLYLWPDTYAQDADLTGAVYLWPDDAYNDSGVDFTVQVPGDIVITAGGFAYLTAQINEYRLAGKQFNIVRV